MYLKYNFPVKFRFYGQTYNHDSGKYGGRNTDGSWNGMIREVIDGSADIAVQGAFFASVRGDRRLFLLLTLFQSLNAFPLSL